MKKQVDIVVERIRRWLWGPAVTGAEKQWQDIDLATERVYRELEALKRLQINARER